LIKVILTREDANTEFALLAEWLVGDREPVKKGQLLCVVETSKASIEVESPGEGTLLHLYREGTEVELGREVALIAERPDELVGLLEDRQGRAPEEAASDPGKATRKAVELAGSHGVDLAAIEKRGFITGADVEAFVRRREGTKAVPAERLFLAGISTDGVTLPRALEHDESIGALDPEFLESLRAAPEAFRALPSEEKCETYRRHGARIGREVELEEGALLLAPRIVIEDGVRIGRGGSVRCEEAFAVGALTQFGPGLELACRRAFVGEGVHAGRSIRVGGGGHRDPWAVLAIGDLTFIGDEVFINPCRPVLIGREVFLTQRSMIVTHNIGHSVLEGFENRFAPVVLEDMSQIGLGSVVYAGCRVGRRAIVGSNSYVISDIPVGTFAIGVPARVAGQAQRKIARSKQVELARRMVDELEELLALRGHAVLRLAGADVRGFELETVEGRSVVAFVERVGGADELPSAEAEVVVLTLEYGGGEPPGGAAVLDLIEKRLYGRGGILLDSVREFCRKKGIRLAPGPWRYRGGLI
jgi:acetyltransferase-like isoleucine patch superfamily enzyme